jgi:hypothetical protein
MTRTDETLTSGVELEQVDGYEFRVRMERCLDATGKVADAVA